MKEQLSLLRQFNEKVTRLENTRFAKWLDASTPNVTARMDAVRVNRTGDMTFEIIGTTHATLDEHDQDDLDAFVLTYRMFVQKRDVLSIRSLAKIYEAQWMPSEARDRFREAREAVNDLLDSPTSLLDGEHVVTRRELVDVILYGGLAHSEQGKVPMFNAWMRTGVAGFFWAEFVVTLKEMLRLLRFFRELNRAVIVNCAT
jgi:hypothetical protein